MDDERVSQAAGGVARRWSLRFVRGAWPEAPVPVQRWVDTGNSDLEKEVMRLVEPDLARASVLHDIANWDELSSLGLSPKEALAGAIGHAIGGTWHLGWRLCPWISATMGATPSRYLFRDLMHYDWKSARWIWDTAPEVAEADLSYLRTDKAQDYPWIIRELWRELGKPDFGVVESALSASTQWKVEG